MPATAIPNRAVFRSQEVCDIVQVQPYVLRSWEVEFPDLGLSKSAEGPRVYRRADVERVLRLKHLLFVEGLTLAGARKQLSQEGVVAPVVEVSDEVDDSEVASMMDAELKDGLREVRRGLGWVLGVLTGADPNAAELRLTAPKGRRGKTKAGGRSAKKPVRSAKSVRRGKAGRAGKTSKRSIGRKKR